MLPLTLQGSFEQLFVMEPVNLVDLPGHAPSKGLYFLLALYLLFLVIFQHIRGTALGGWGRVYPRAERPVAFWIMLSLETAYFLIALYMSLR